MTSKDKRFKSKTELVKHIKVLEDEGYFIRYEVYSDDGRNEHLHTFFKINFGSVT